MGVQNTKFGYATIGKQTNPEIPVQTLKPIMRIDGDIKKQHEKLKNTSIQNIRNNASTLVDGNEFTEGELNMELSAKEIVWFLCGALGKLTSTDVSSLTDGSVYEHVIEESSCDLIPLSIEMKMGGCTGGSLDPTGQTHVISRAFGCTVDTLTMEIAEGILTVQSEIKAYGSFDTAKLIEDESIEAASTAITGGSWAAGVATITSVGHGLSLGDLVVVAGVTPSGYDGAFTITEVVDVDNVKVSIEVDPGAYVSGGTIEKQATFRFQKGTTKGLVIGDTVKLFEKNTGTYEDVVVTALDTGLDKVGFASVTSTLFTVANDSKIELAQKIVNYDSPELFGFKNARIRVGNTLAEAAIAQPINVKTATINIANNLQVDSQTEFNTVKSTGSDYEIEMGLLFNDVNIRDDFRNKKEQAMIIEIDNANIVSGTDTNNETFRIEMHVPKFAYQSYEMEAGTGSLIEETVNALVLFDPDSSKSIFFKVYNDHDNAFYTT